MQLALAIVDQPSTLRNQFQRWTLQWFRVWIHSPCAALAVLLRLIATADFLFIGSFFVGVDTGTCVSYRGPRRAQQGAAQ